MKNKRTFFVIFFVVIVTGLMNHNNLAKSADYKPTEIVTHAKPEIPIEIRDVLNSLKEASKDSTLNIIDIKPSKGGITFYERDGGSVAVLFGGPFFIGNERQVIVGGWTFNFNNASSAKKFADAFSKLRLNEEAPYQQKVRAWQALPVKPPLPEQANRYRVLAEDAFKNKDFHKAIDYYNKGLEIYPLWPEGQFNAALICGETGSYIEAVGHMKRYLELVPEAKDAKAAREKIYIWEEKAK